MSHINACNPVSWTMILLKLFLIMTIVHWDQKSRSRILFTQNKTSRWIWTCRTRSRINQWRSVWIWRLPENQKRPRIADRPWRERRIKSRWYFQSQIWVWAISQKSCGHMWTTEKQGKIKERRCKGKPWRKCRSSWASWVMIAFCWIRQILRLWESNHRKYILRGPRTRSRMMEAQNRILLIRMTTKNCERIRYRQ